MADEDCRDLPGDRVLSYALAVLAACANAVSSVLQRKANRSQPRQRTLNWRLLAGLLRRPVWLGGLLAVIAGFGLQAAALAFGELAAVQPVLVLELPATLALSSLVFRSRLRGREWGCALAMTVSVAVLLYLLAPSGGPVRRLPWHEWVLGLGVTVAVVLGLVGWARRGLARQPGSRPAALLGVAAGMLFGLTAALMKGTTAAFGRGVAAVVTGWQFYGMIAAGATAMFLVQMAMNTGRLIATQPGLTLADPIVALLWGVFGFHERVRGGGLVVPEIACAAVLAASVLVLARSPVLSAADRPEQPATPRPSHREASCSDS
ncbi:MAG TPA: DMT family transporter [Pseudonocardiaceae bacterium]|nr:DMT family transporter [Pseudonocardiaceae bacterium]